MCQRTGCSGRRVACETYRKPLTIYERRSVLLRALGQAGEHALLGSVSLPVVTARIDRFITEDGKGPYPNME